MNKILQQNMVIDRAPIKGWEVRIYLYDSEGEIDNGHRLKVDEINMLVKIALEFLREEEVTNPTL